MKLIYKENKNSDWIIKSITKHKGINDVKLFMLKNNMDKLTHQCFILDKLNIIDLHERLKFDMNLNHDDNEFVITPINSRIKDKIGLFAFDYYNEKVNKKTKLFGNFSFIDNNYVDISMVKSFYKNRGFGRLMFFTGLNFIINKYPKADICLIAIPMDDETNMPQLLNFYKSFNFEIVNRGRFSAELKYKK